MTTKPRPETNSHGAGSLALFCCEAATHARIALRRLSRDVSAVAWGVASHASTAPNAAARASAGPLRGRGCVAERRPMGMNALGGNFNRARRNDRSKRAAQWARAM